MPGKDLIPRPAVQPPAEIAPPWQQRKKQSEAAYRTIGRWARRNRHATVPLAVPAMLFAAGAILHAARAAGYVLVAWLVLAAVMCVLAPSKWDRAGERLYAQLSAILGGFWLWLAAAIGPAARTVSAAVLAGILLTACGAWGFLWWKHKRPRGRRRREKRIAKWDAWWQSHCWEWNLGGSRVTDAQEMRVTTKIRIQGIPGKHSIQYIRQVLHLIESAVEGLADIGMIRAEPVKGNPSQFDLFFKRENPLREPVEYDLAMAPQSVHDPMPDGLTETGEWKMTTLRANSFVIGQIRSGKSNRLLVRVVALSGCPDGRSVVIDLKGGRSARPVLKAAAAEYVITEADEARMYLMMGVAETHARAKYAYTGEEQLLATPEVPSLHTFIDETHGLTSVANGNADCARLLALLASQGPGLELYSEVYTQHGSLEESVRTEQTRANLPLRVAYRVAEPRHGAYAIPEYAKLDASRLEEKGTCYVKDGPEALAEQIRTQNMPHKLFPRIAAQNAAAIGTRPPLRLYCGEEMSPAGVTWQEWWDSRWGRLEPAFRSDSPQYQAYAAMLAAGSPAEAHDAISRIHADAREDAAPSPVPGEGDGRSAAEQIAGELASAHRGIPDTFSPSPRVVSRMKDVRQRQRQAFADALGAASPRQGISPRQLAEESGAGRTWIHQMLAALAENDAVAQLRRGLYAPLPGADIMTAIELIEAGNDQLLREARADGRRRLTPVP
jgi:hypothetical protein